jgi:hypothetical protein
VGRSDKGVSLTKWIPAELSRRDPARSLAGKSFLRQNNTQLLEDLPRLCPQTRGDIGLKIAYSRNRMRTSVTSGEMFTPRLGALFPPHSSGSLS